MKSLAAGLMVAAALTAPAAWAQCNTTGISSGCDAQHPYSCAASPTCYSQLASCQSHVCGCNTSGVATGCDAAHPYSCPVSTTCHAAYGDCTTDAECLGSSSGTGGGSGGGGTGTGGVGWGCSAGASWAPAGALLALGPLVRRRRAQAREARASSQA